MGGTTSRDQLKDDVSSLKKLKQNHFVENVQQKKKKSFIFSSISWRKFIESTKRKSNKNMTLLRLESPSEKKTNPFHSETVNVVSAKVSGVLSNGITRSKGFHGSSDKLPCGLRDAYSSKENLREISKITRSDAFARPRSTVSNHASAHQANNTPPVSSRDKRARKHLIQASTSELLDCLGQFVCQRCHRVTDIEPSDIPTWFREVDRTLFKLGWHEISFIMPSSVVFVYLLCREMLLETVTTVFEVQCIVLTCLYVSYSYMGNEISYPLRPFLIEQERSAFWGRCCAIVKRLSGVMLRINSNSHYFTTVFRELITFAPRPLKSHTESAFQNRTIINGERRR